MSNQRNRLTTAQTLQRRTQLIQLRARKTPWTQIATQLGYSDDAAAATDYRRTLEILRNDFKLTGEEHVQEELEHLEDLTRRTIDLLDRDYTKWIGGEDGGGEEFDPSPKLQAIAELRRLSGERRKLLGIDAPTRVEADGQLQITIGVTEAELENLT